jgi:hypothetical protein
MRIVSSIGDPFEGQFALRLRASARSQGIDCDLFDRARKPGGDGRPRLAALIRSLAEGHGEDLLYVDPDAHLLRRPDILLDERDFDVGLYYHSRTLEPSGPVFIRNNSRVAALLRTWATLNEVAPEQTDLENLSRAISRPGLGLEVRRFPVTYAWVERQHRRTYPTAQPIIVHFKTESLLSSRGNSSKPSAG